MAVLVFLVVMNDSNCILRCRPSGNSKLLPLLLFSMNSLAPWKSPHPSKPFEIRLQRIARIESPLPIGSLVGYLVHPCYCMQWITVHSQQAGNKINRVRFSNMQLSSNIYAVTFLLPCWIQLHYCFSHRREWKRLHTKTNETHWRWIEILFLVRISSCSSFLFWHQCESMFLLIRSINWIVCNEVYAIFHRSNLVFTWW